MGMNAPETTAVSRVTASRANVLRANGASRARDVLREAITVPRVTVLRENGGSRLTDGDQAARCRSRIPM